MTGLNDKTIVIAGPFGLLNQNLITRLTEYGADVVLITDEVKSAQRVCQNIMDMREVSEKFGRATALAAKIETEKDAELAFNRSAEAFGSTDIYIDIYLYALQIPFNGETSKAQIEKSFNETFLQSRLMTQAATAYLKARTRGRILYIFQELDWRSAIKANCTVFNELSDFIQKSSIELSAQNVSVNGLAVGANEEYLLTRFAKNSTIQNSLKELRQSLPQTKLVDYNDIANMTTFLVSPQSSGLSGQIIHLNHGSNIL